MQAAPFGVEPASGRTWSIFAGALLLGEPLQQLLSADVLHILLELLVHLGRVQQSIKTYGTLCNNLNQSKKMCYMQIEHQQNTNKNVFCSPEG